MERNGRRTSVGGKRRVKDGSLELQTSSYLKNEKKFGTPFSVSKENEKATWMAR